MDKTYISSSRTFSFEYPENWKLEHEENGHIILSKKGGFFKKGSENRLRVTPFLSEQVITPEIFTALVNRRKKEHPGLEVIEKSDFHVMNFQILKYRQETFQNLNGKVVDLVQDCWELAISNRIFNCTFSSIKGLEDMPATIEERETAERILYSLKLL